jgi:nicotinamide riboside transporter PnuC
VLAAIIVIVAWATGGRLLRALVFAAVFFLLATGWSWWRWSQRLTRERAAAKPGRR